MPNAPEWIGPLAAMTLAEGGDRQGARRLVSELLNSDEAYIRAAAERSLSQLDALDAIDGLQRTIERFNDIDGPLPVHLGRSGPRGSPAGIPVT